ncbi:MAG TPA: secretin and TonB N-terminal domain-containing protein [Burkholderiales bacterium]|nr:secretin and TonB N-terminal domain-containing protein [Burkholderiales bacterium]
MVDQAREYMHAGRGEEALALLEDARRQAPNEPQLRTEYFRLRDLMLAQWLSQAEPLRLAGRFEVAEDLYRRMLKYDPQNVRAQAGLAQIAIDQRHRAQIGQAQKLINEEKYSEAQEALRPVLAENPQQREARKLQRLIEEKTAKPAIEPPRLKSRTAKPITIELRDVSLSAVFDLVSRTYGVSFVFDKEVRGDQRINFSVRDTSLEDIVRLLLAANQLEQKVINEGTVLIFPNTPAKQREYQETVIRSFYLVNADVKQTANMIRSVIKTRDLFVDEKLNLLVIRDTPSAIRLAERLIAAQDLAEPEVMLEVEVLEVGSTRLLELGLKYPESIAWSLVGAAGIPGTITLPEWLNRSSSLVQLTVTNPLFLLSLKQADGSTSVLANPRIRVKNREKARVHIGDRVPVITTTAAATGGFVSESVSYLDVGLKLEVEPQIYLEDEVGIKVGLEVSNIANVVKGNNNNTLAYQIGTRNASTTLRLRDGETQILAGLISDEDRRTANRVPGLGNLPVLGRLFSSTSDNATKTEIVLLITPRLVRTLARPDARTAEFAAGTEISTGGGGPGGVPTPIPPPQPQPPAGTAPSGSAYQPQPGQPTPLGQPDLSVPSGQPGQPAPSGPTMYPFGGVQQERRP